MMFLPEDESALLLSGYNFAYDQIDINATQLIGQPKNTNYDEMRIDGFVAPDQGYVLVYLSNESSTLVDVHFDDISIVVNEHPVVQKDDYYPFGLQHSGGYQRITAKENRYLYNGKELQTDLDLDWYDYGARMYMPDLGRWNAIDPLSDDYLQYSPYNYTLNNPIIYVDPDGRFVAPIYGTDGKFLGTDDQGLQGNAIIMNEENFKQGMSHEEAQSKSLGREGLESDEAFNKVAEHYHNLPSRPDYDGKLTFREVTKWSNEGSGDPLFVDGAKINLDNTTVTDVINAEENNQGYIDYFVKGGKDNIGIIYGNIKLKLKNEKTGEVELGNKGLLDIHDFKNPVFKAINDGLYIGKPKNFKIYCAPCNNKVKTDD